jgi:ATP-dependent Clp protease ATP-binding subunit ClpB
MDKLSEKEEKRKDDTTKKQTETEDLESVPFSLDKDIMPELRMKFKPEMLNRRDEIIVFNPITKMMLSKIAEIELNRYIKLIAQEKGMELSYDQSVVDYVVEK